MHQRRILMAAALDALYAANQAPMPANADNNLGAALVGKLDFSRVGLMGHSRGGDAVSSFIDYNRTRPAPGRKYNLRGVISLAPVDYERRAPYGVPYMTILRLLRRRRPNLQGARLFERSQYIQPGDPFPRIQVSLLGANHNWFNTVWFADGDDATGTDAACGTSQPNNIRLTRRHVRPHHPRLRRSGADGRPGEGRPGDDVVVLPPLRRRRRRVRPVHDRRGQRGRHDAAAARLGLPDLARPAPASRASTA